MDVSSGGFIKVGNLVPFIREISLLSGLPIDTDTEALIIEKIKRIRLVTGEARAFTHKFVGKPNIPVEFMFKEHDPEILFVTSMSDVQTGRYIKLLALLMSRYTLVEND